MKAALEMAVWDICGKLAGQPVYKLLGGYRDSFETDITIGMGTPAEMAAKAIKYVQDGFKTLKIKLGEGPEPDTARMKALRDAIGYGTKLRTDANQGWTAAETVRALRMMEKYQMQICEQPVPYWNVEGLKYARDNPPTPIMADESVHSPYDAFAVTRENAVDCINIKLMKAGGHHAGRANHRGGRRCRNHLHGGLHRETRVGLRPALTWSPRRKTSFMPTWMRSWNSRSIP